MWSEDHACVDPEFWQRAGRAINQRERLRLRCQRFDGANREYLLGPCPLVAYHGNWYLLAVNLSAGRMETFFRMLRSWGRPNCGSASGSECARD